MQVTCEYDSTGQQGTTYSGSTHHDEMCNMYMMVRSRPHMTWYKYTWNRSHMHVPCRSCLAVGTARMCVSSMCHCITVLACTCMVCAPVSLLQPDRAHACTHMRPTSNSTLLDPPRFSPHVSARHRPRHVYSTCAGPARSCLLVLDSAPGTLQPSPADPLRLYTHIHISHTHMHAGACTPPMTITTCFAPVHPPVLPRTRVYIPYILRWTSSQLLHLTRPVH